MNVINRINFNNGLTTDGSVKRNTVQRSRGRVVVTSAIIVTM